MRSAWWLPCQGLERHNSTPAVPGLRRLYLRKLGCHLYFTFRWTGGDRPSPVGRPAATRPTGPDLNRPHGLPLSPECKRVRIRPRGPTPLAPPPPPRYLPPRMIDVPTVRRIPASAASGRGPRVAVRQPVPPLGSKGQILFVEARIPRPSTSSSAAS